MSEIIEIASEPNFDPTPDGAISPQAIRERGLNGGW